MPIHEPGYRSWNGKLLSPLLRPLLITRAGVRLALKSKALRRFLFVAWAPLLYFAPLFFLVGYVTETGIAPDMTEGLLGAELSRALARNPDLGRPAVWSLAFYYVSFTQLFMCVIVTAIVGPTLIANDIRTKALLLYFSKPITRLEYLFGKGCVVLSYLLFVSLLPALVIYAISIVFSPSVDVLAQTAMTIPRIGLAALVVAIPSTLLMLMLSSITTEPRYASLGWISLWILGEFSYYGLLGTPGFYKAPWLPLVSLRQAMHVTIESIYDVSAILQGFAASRGMGPARPEYSATLMVSWLAAISLVCALVVWRRVSAQMNI